jgi:hypothetical protein
MSKNRHSVEHFAEMNAFSMGLVFLVLPLLLVFTVLWLMRVLIG